MKWSFSQKETVLFGIGIATGAMLYRAIDCCTISWVTGFVTEMLK